MELKRVHVTNFRSAEDSEIFGTDRVTCLVGKNEAGKSAILQALASLNPHPSTPIVLNKERDYPSRFLTAFKERHPKGEATAVTTHWELSDSEVQAIEGRLGKNAVASKEVKITREYEAKSPSWHIELNFAKIFETFFAKHALDAAERAPLKGAGDTTELIQKLEAIAERSAKQAALLTELQGLKTFPQAAVSVVSDRLPRFMYFANYDRMDGAVQIQNVLDLIQNNQLDADQHRGKKLFKEFFELAGVPLNEIVNIGTYETFNARLKAASNGITDQIMEYWTQNPYLSVEVKVEQHRPQDPPPFNSGMIARARINNSLHRVDTQFSERSAGFVWFFSFLVKFAQVKNDATPVVLLLDEPGMSLHGKAQADLLRYFDEKLAPHHQIIYSTHSPFMVAPDKLLSARIVEDRVEINKGRPVPIGTKVREDVLSRDPDTLFPLQGALGYEITQTLFIGKDTLLVEGPGDILYLKALSAALDKLGRKSLSPRWTITPSGGIGGIRPFMGLFVGNNLNVTVLLDYAEGQKKEAERLRSGDILKSDRVLLMSEVAGKKEADIEDIFEPELFCAIVNNAYGLKTSRAMTPEKLAKLEPQTERLVKKAEAYFRTEVTDLDMYSHYKPAEWLLLNPDFLVGKPAGSVPTFDRAETLFTKLNALLS